MADTEDTNNGSNEYSVTWCIENYSYCWQNNGKGLVCPEFTADGLNGTKWYIQVYPRGDRESSRSNISIYLNRSKNDSGPEIFPLKFELSILASDGSAFVSRKMEHSFKKGSGFGSPNFVRMDKVLQCTADFLNVDRFRVRCVIVSGEGNIQLVTQFNALTRIGIQHMSFLHTVDDFSSLKPNEMETIEIKSPSGYKFLTSNVYYSDDSCCKGKVMVDIVPYSIGQYGVLGLGSQTFTSTTTEVNKHLIKCKLSILDSSGKIIECCAVDSRFNCTREDIKKLPLSLTKTTIMNNKEEYLPDDKLSLLCTCTFSTGVELEKIEETMHQLPLVAVNLMNSNDLNKDKPNIVEKLSTCPSVQDDLKAVYNNLFHTDVELKTKTKSFPAHKLVLCARSPVFKAMLTSEMKENIMDCIPVDDLDNDTIRQLLLFLYSDELENLQWESAIKQYYAGDKYDIEKLKVLCSAFLLDNLSTSNATELLLLADKHNDPYLRNFTENFILEHDEEVFGSDEWEKLMETNLQLSNRTMHLKYKRNKVNKTQFLRIV